MRAVAAAIAPWNEPTGRTLVLSLPGLGVLYALASVASRLSITPPSASFIVLLTLISIGFAELMMLPFVAFAQPRRRTARLALVLIGLLPPLSIVASRQILPAGLHSVAKFGAFASIATTGAVVVVGVVAGIFRLFVWITDRRRAAVGKPELAEATETWFRSMSRNQQAGVLVAGYGLLWRCLSWAFVPPPGSSGLARVMVVVSGFAQFLNEVAASLIAVGLITIIATSLPSRQPSEDEKSECALARDERRHDIPHNNERIQGNDQFRTHRSQGSIGGWEDTSVQDGRQSGQIGGG